MQLDDKAWQEVSKFMSAYAKKHNAVPSREQIQSSCPSRQGAIDRALELITERESWIPSHVIVKALANFGLGKSPPDRSSREVEALGELRKQVQDTGDFDEVYELLKMLSDDDPPPDGLA